MNAPTEPDSPAGQVVPLTPEEVAALSFEEALDRLEETVAQLEAGDLSLEDSLRLFEEGMLLRQACAERLQAAEARVETVLAEGAPAPGTEAGQEV